jgi:hypothetical protein
MVMLFAQRAAWEFVWATNSPVNRQEPFRALGFCALRQLLSRFREGGCRSATFKTTHGQHLLYDEIASGEGIG